MNMMTNSNMISLLAVFMSLAVSPLYAQGQQMPPKPVSVAGVTSTQIKQTVPIAGTIYSRNDVQITAAISGPLVFVAEPGTYAEAGDVVARIDDTDLRLQKLEQKALAHRAKISLRFLNSQLERQRSLAQTLATSINQLEQTESDRDVAESDLSIAALRLERIQEQLDRAVIRAPFSGVITDRLRREGEYVSPGNVLARLTDTENLEVRVAVPVNYAGRVNRGDSLKMFGFESEFSGSIRSVIPSTDVRSQTFEIRVELPEDAGRKWSIGQLISVAVPMRSMQETLVVPRDALILRREGTYVYRIDENNTAHRIIVETGDGDGAMVAISGELKAGDQVAIRGAETLQEGSIVNIINHGQVAGSAANPGGG